MPPLHFLTLPVLYFTPFAKCLDVKVLSTVNNDLFTQLFLLSHFFTSTFRQSVLHPFSGRCDCFFSTLFSAIRCTLRLVWCPVHTTSVFFPLEAIKVVFEYTLVLKSPFVQFAFQPYIFHMQHREPHFRDSERKVKFYNASKYWEEFPLVCTNVVGSIIRDFYTSTSAFPLDPIWQLRQVVSASYSHLGSVLGLYSHLPMAYVCTGGWHDKLQHSPRMFHHLLLFSSYSLNPSFMDFLSNPEELIVLTFWWLFTSYDCQVTLTLFLSLSHTPNRGVESAQHVASLN